MSNPLVTGVPTLNLDLLLGYASDQTLVFTFLLGGEAFPLIGEYKLQVFSSKNSTTPIFELTEADTLVRDANTLTAPFTVSQTTVEQELCFWRLRNITTNQNWYVGKIRFNKGEMPDADYQVTQEMNVGQIVIQANMTLAGFDVDDLTATQLQALANALAPYFLG